MLLALSSSFALAAEDSNLTTKAMNDHPGTMGGSTSNPTAKPDSGSLSEKQMQDQPGVNGDTSGHDGDAECQARRQLDRRQGNARQSWRPEVKLWSVRQLFTAGLTSAHCKPRDARQEIMRQR